MKTYSNTDHYDLAAQNSSIPDLTTPEELEAIRKHQERIEAIKAQSKNKPVFYSPDPMTKVKDAKLDKLLII